MRVGPVICHVLSNFLQYLQFSYIQSTQKVIVLHTYKAFVCSVFVEQIVPYLGISEISLMYTCLEPRTSTHGQWVVVGEIRNLLCLHSLFDWPFTELFMHVYHGTMLGSRCNLCLN